MKTIHITSQDELPDVAEAVIEALGRRTVVALRGEMGAGKTTLIKKLLSEALANGADIKADVLKLGHHGSSTSTSEEFLKVVSPSLALISCGKDNDYGHPHKETLEKLEKYNIPYERTNIKGTIVVGSDGEHLSTAFPDNKTAEK